MKGKSLFIQGLRELGYSFEDMGGDKVAYESKITSGTFAGRPVRVGLVVPSDFEMTAPHGPHVFPRLLPNNTGTEDHKSRVHGSEFGDNWMQLSRPHKHWERTKKTVEVYVDYVAWLLNTL